MPTSARFRFWESGRDLRSSFAARYSPFIGLIAALAGCNSATRNPELKTQAESGVFRDIALSVGLDFHWGHDGKSPLNIIETIGHGSAFIDYDQDGLLDVFLAGTPRCALYRNVNGRFQNVSEGAGIHFSGTFFGVAVGDYDNDGYPDIYLTGYGCSRLLYNNRNGRFEDVTDSAGLRVRGQYDVATAAAFADLDSDGRLDLIVGRYIKFTPQTLQYCTYSGVKAGCGVKNYESDLPSVFRNLGGGRFGDVTSQLGFDTSRGKTLGVAIRAPDSGRGAIVYMANDEEPGDLFVPAGGKYRNEGIPSGTAYSREGLTQGGMGTDWGDYNLDGKPDLVVATFQTEPKCLYRSDGGGLYSEMSGPLGIASGTSPYVGWTARFFDYDNDRWPDLLFTNGHTQDNVQKVEADRTFPQPLLLYHNERGERYTNASDSAGAPFRTSIVGRGASFGDFDNDGRVDVLIVNDEGGPLLLRNESATKNHWVGIRLKGTSSNRDGIGARIEVFGKDGKIVKDHQLAGGYISAHDPRIHFGLGDWTSIDRIVVHWPSGRIDTIERPSIDRYLTVEEGSSSKAIKTTALAK